MLSFARKKKHKSEAPSRRSDTDSTPLCDKAKRQRKRQTVEPKQKDLEYASDLRDKVEMTTLTRSNKKLCLSLRWMCTSTQIKITGTMILYLYLEVYCIPGDESTSSIISRQGL